MKPAGFRHLIFALMLLLVAATVPARAPVQIPDVRPGADTVQGVAVENVTFPTISPFVPVDMRNGTDVPRTAGITRLFLPPHAPKDPDARIQRRELIGAR